MSDFASFARAHGLDIEHLSTSTRIRRCGTDEKPSSKAGAYWYDGDRGWVQRWDQGGELMWWDDPNKQEPTREQRAEWAARAAAYEQKQLEKWGKTAQHCRMLQEDTKVREHNYMHRKHLGDIKVRVLNEYEQTDSDGVIETLENVLFIPMLHFGSDAMVGAQLIWWDTDARVFQKKFVPGSRLKDSHLRLGPSDTDEVILCEGFATGHSINKALISLNLRATILVCFNDSNMVNVSKLLPEGLRSYVFADNDASRAGERAAKATGLAYCMSPQVGEDANDLHTRAGLVEVGTLIMAARKAALRSAVDNP
jgi:putative DNA primase/helicase